MTDTELDALEAAAKAATPGPWEAYHGEEHHIIRSFKNKPYSSNGQIIAWCGKMGTEHDWPTAAYIAAANPAAILELIAELRELKSRYPHPQYSYEL